MSSPDEKKPDPPVIDPDVAAAGDFILRTRMLVRMGISFQDPRLQAALNQLAWWPQVVFTLAAGEDGKPLAEAAINEADKVVDYRLTLTDVPEKDELAKRAGALVGWTQQLLGEEWKVLVSHRKPKAAKYKRLFEGERLKPLDANAAPHLTDAPFPDAVTKFSRYRTDSKKLTLDDTMDLGPIIRPKQQ